jgi:hypothetical protein
MMSLPLTLRLQKVVPEGNAEPLGPSGGAEVVNTWPKAEVLTSRAISRADLAIAAPKVVGNLAHPEVGTPEAVVA